MAAPRLSNLQISNYRSVGTGPVTITFPEAGPLVVLGENNAGKSNITRALDLLFGERWPGSYQPEDHEFFGRSPDGVEISMGAGVENVSCDKCDGHVQYVRWKYYLGHEENPNSFSRTSTCFHSWMTNAVREQLFCMSIGADRRLSYQLSYASKFTFLSKLMKKFHEKLTADISRVSRLQEIFESLLGEFGSVREFDSFRRLLADTAEAFGQNLAYRLDIDFSAYDPSNFYRSLRVHPKLGGDVRSFDELGTGQEQILALAFSYAYAKAFGENSGLVLVIDEPESHLHPLAQQWLASRLDSMAVDGLQIVLTTHSPHFVNLARPENLVLVRKPDDTVGTCVTQVNAASLATSLVAAGADPVRTTPGSVGPFYAANATQEIVSGLFARTCVLVEGPTESLALPGLLSLVGFDTLKAGIAVIPVGGVGNIARWYRIFTTLGIDTYAIFDTDANKTGRDASKLQAQRQDILRAANRAELEASDMTQEAMRVEPEFAVLNANFEAAMREMFRGRWEALEERSLAVVGETKPLQARYVVQHLQDSDISGPTRMMLERLARAIEGKLTVGKPDEAVTFELGVDPML